LFVCPFRKQPALSLASVRGRVGQRSYALHAELWIGSARKRDDVFLLGDICSRRTEIEVAGEENSFGAFADDVDRTVGAERRLGFIVEFHDLDRLPKHAPGGVDVGDRKLRASYSIGVDRRKPTAERHHQTEDRLIGCPADIRGENDRDRGRRQRGHAEFSDHVTLLLIPLSNQIFWRRLLCRRASGNRPAV